MVGVAGGGQMGAVVCQVEVDVQAAGEQTGADVGHEAVGPCEDVAGQCACCGVGVHGGADLAHEGCGVHIVTFDVADGCGSAGGIAADEVVEVAADIDAAGGGEVSRDHLKARDGGQDMRQQGVLQTVGELVFRVVEAGPVQGLGDQPGQ